MARYLPLLLLLFACNHKEPVPPIVQPKPDTVDVRFHTYCPYVVTRATMWVYNVNAVHDTVFDWRFTGGNTVKCFDTTLRIKRGAAGNFSSSGGQAVYVEYEGKDTMSSTESVNFKIE